MDPTVHFYLQVSLLCLQLIVTVYMLIGNPYMRNHLKWLLVRSKKYTLLVSKDSDWREWLEFQLGREGRHWKAEEDHLSFFLFKHNISKIDIVIKKKYDPYITQFRLMYEQAKP
jgi:hypothetical protein